MPQNLNENPSYLCQQLITYIGNKRSLLPLIEEGLCLIQKQMKKTRLSIADLFSGSGITARFFKKYAHTLHVNDLEDYARIINECYLSNEDDIDFHALHSHHQALCTKLSDLPLKEGIITQLYAPKNDQKILPGERVFYTRRNAQYLDTARQYIFTLPASIQPFFLAPLLSEASIHANTSGVFKGFYKNARGIGQFGGKAQNALQRITGDITLPFPVFSRFSSHVHIYQQDANTLASQLENIDIAYLDPPYNQHPYGSNYFMLNLLVNYKNPKNISRVSGIPKDWNRSDYNRKKYACATLRDLCAALKAKYLMISFNSEGFIQKEEMEAMLGELGTVITLKQDYPAFRASRNLHNRNIYVKEYLYIVRK